ncbi:MAG: AAA family ATPase [Alphaproteobacteria bacterium]|nr:AAA family ATPase [Alphaproteobacteria bacterium]MBN2780184.1 AAA family ATPase [Alphaproteobacteria bacterium]
MFLPPIETTFFTGHDSIEQGIFSDYQAGRLPHAMLFHGASGVGKETFAYRLSRFILSEQSKDMAVDLSVLPEDPIVHQIVENNCLTFYNIGPDPEKKTPIIDVAQIRNLKQKLYKTVEKNQARVILIHPADAMNTAAANALLKVLEEPPKNTYFILVAGALDALLPTIRSRCRLVRFSGLSVSAMKKICVHSKEGATEALIQKANGSMGNLQTYLAEKDLLSDLEKVIKKPEEMGGFLKKYADSSSMKTVFDLLAQRFQTSQKWENLNALEQIWKDYDSFDLDRQTTLVLMLSVIGEGDLS